MRYPAVELLTGVVFALHAFVFEPGPLLLVRLVFAAVLIVLAFIDIDHRILPDSMTLTGIPLGVLASVWLPPGWRDSLIGVALGGGSLWLIAEGYYRWRKVEGMGMGDVKMLAMIGAVLGWRAVVVTLVLSSCSGALVGVLMISAGQGRPALRAAVRHVPVARGARRQPGRRAAGDVVSLVLSVSDS